MQLEQGKSSTGLIGSFRSIIKEEGYVLRHFMRAFHTNNIVTLQCREVVQRSRSTLDVGGAKESSEVVSKDFSCGENRLIQYS